MTDIYVADTHRRARPDLSAGADRVHGRLAGAPRRAKPDRGRSSSAPPSCTARMSGISPKSTPRSTSAHGAEQSTDAGTLAVRVGAWLTDADGAASGRASRARDGRQARRRARAHARALEPYLMQIRLERSERSMREPAFWWREPASRPRLLHPLAAIYGAVAGARAWSARPRAPACRSSASAISPSAAPARRRPRSRSRGC